MISPSVKNGDAWERMVRRRALWADVKAYAQQAALAVVLIAMGALFVGAYFYGQNRTATCHAKGGAWIEGQCLDVRTIEVP